MKLCDSVTGQPLCFESNDNEYHAGGILRHAATVFKSEQCNNWVTILSDVGIAAARRRMIFKGEFGDRRNLEIF